jgi:hypothetical protein
MGRLEGRLTERGPMIDVKIMLTAQHVEALKRAGKPYAAPMTIRGLVDTGASSSCVDRNIVVGLGLAARGVVAIHTPSSGDAYEERLQYDACLVLGEGQGDALVLTLPVIESDFASQGFLALIGRDVLKSCRLIYDGPAETFTVEWNSRPRTSKKPTKK